MKPIKKGLAYRISVIIVTAITLLAIFVLATNYFVGKQLSQFDQETNRRLSLQKSVQELHQQFQTVAFSVRGYLAFDRKSFLDETTLERQGFKETYDRVKELLKADDKNQAENKQILARIAIDWQKYENSIATAVQLKHANNLAGLEQFSREQGTPIVNEINKDMTTLAMIQENEIQSLIKQKAAYSNWLLLWPLLLILGFAVTGFYLIRYVRKSMIIPLIHLEQNVMKIGTGEYVPIKLTNRNDELSNLQFGINDMIGKIQLREQELELKNLELIEQRDLLEAQNEEIVAQQEEQHDTLEKLTERELELEQITSYQEKLTGFVEYQAFLEHAIPSLLTALQLDAAMVVRRESRNDGTFRIDYACGYPNSSFPRMEVELFGVAERVFTEKRSFFCTRPLTGQEQGIHAGYETATDFYYPLHDDSQQVTGFLLLTSYSGASLPSESRVRVTTGLIRQFSLALVAQLVNEDRFKQRDLIQTILESTHEGFVFVNRDGLVVFANSQMEEYFTFSRFIGDKLSRFISELGNGKLHDQIESFLTGETEQLQERFSYTSEKEIRYFELYANVVQPSSGAVDGYLFVFRDRTEEEQVDELKNEFISIVSHELRTPLATVLGFMEILLHRNVAPEKQQKYMETIYKEANRLSQLINDFLDLQRMESGREVYHFEPINMSDVVMDVTEQWQNKSTQEIRISYPEQPIFTLADQDRIKQVVHNLISNACKYSPGANRVDVRLYTQQGQAYLEVQDYGLGIPDEAKDKLFTKFYRVDNSDRRQIGGTGLGLAIVKEILEVHHGSISFTSELGKGTTFTVQLDKFQAADVSGKIIILEDDENLSKMIGVAFEKLELPVVHLSTAEAAIFSLKQSKGKAPLLCIVDIQLGGTRSGWDFIRELHDHPIYTETPVIVSTVLEPPLNYYQNDKEKYLKKPFTIERLLELSTELLQNRENGSVYVFPYQDRDSVRSSLLDKGFEVTDVQVKQDIIQVDVKKNESN